jgi:hypothetical protein
LELIGDVKLWRSSNRKADVKRMAEHEPEGPMDQDLQHLEEQLHRLITIARTLSRDADASYGEVWNEPYAYRAANAALSARRNLRRQLEARWLVTPLSPERPDEVQADTPTRRGKKTPS